MRISHDSLRPRGLQSKAVVQDGRKLSYLVDRFRPELGPFEELYRNLHKDPELSNLEVRTADIVASRLRDMGCTTTEHLGGHGVAAILRSGPDATGPCVMLRADMDALPIQEKTGLTYASTKKMVGPDGREAPVMHACGHDLHVACLLAVAALLKSAAPHCWNGTVVLVFQPAEEPLSGAKAMVEDGLFDRVPRPSVVLGHHCTNRRAGAVALSAGPVMAASDSFDVRITGRGGHGAKPQLAIDPVLISAYVLVRLQSIVSREVAPQDVAVVTCGSIHAGSVANVIPDYADLRLNVRTYRPEVRAKVLSAVERILRDECAASGAPEPTLTHTTSVPAIVNSPDEQERETASEDFSFLANAVGVPYAYWNFGTTAPDKWDDAERRKRLDELPGNHSSLFAPSIELSLKTAVNAMAIAALSFLVDETDQVA